jgi:hypothetical protein
MILNVTMNKLLSTQSGQDAYSSQTNGLLSEHRGILVAWDLCLPPCLLTEKFSKAGGGRFLTVGNEDATRRHTHIR